jgi:hypothetical protein
MNSFKPGARSLTRPLLCCMVLAVLPATNIEADTAVLSHALSALIDRELFFDDPEISLAQLSPDGHLIAFVKPLNGTRNIWVKRTADGFDKARPITADTQRPIVSYWWSRDGHYILYSEQIVVAARNHGVPVEYLVAPDEGHGFLQPINNLSAYAEAEKFLAQHVGARYQADVSADEAQRLTVLMVDPRTVVLQGPGRSSVTCLDACSARAGLAPGACAPGAQCLTGALDLRDLRTFERQIANQALLREHKAEYRLVDDGAVVLAGGAL